ncbi:hypothetical protein PMI16_03139 [Herbaspirillum sp. CF444]|uniref:hypothetical protein n=1 Tax=Herbaspirillum sp. CF444 TaxID=1144319 RepID=UPI00027251F1|nr:hypothetical protein [Herbaspirillum sp. CF444]EJL86754.1 hypothetical protein PMI16_03139 [Herbaspirillum sp. CF444]
MKHPVFLHRFTYCLRAATLILSLLTLMPLSARATPLMDLFPEDIISTAQQLKPELNLNPNQQILWRQTEQKTLAIVRQHQLRRDRLQTETARNMSKPGFELRDLGRAVDQESALSEEDSRQLRELWLTVADALDDTQRQAVQAFIADRLQRAAEHGGGSPEKSGGGRAGGKRGGGSGGSGAGMGGGSGGMSGMGGGGESPF